MVPEPHVGYALDKLAFHRGAKLKTHPLFRVPSLPMKMRGEHVKNATQKGPQELHAARRQRSPTTPPYRNKNKAILLKEKNNVEKKVVPMHYGGCQQAFERTAISLNHSTSASLVI